MSGCSTRAALAITRIVERSKSTTSSASHISQKLSRCICNVSILGIKQCTIFDHAYKTTNVNNLWHEPFVIKWIKLTAYRVSSHIDVGKTTGSNGSDSVCNSFFQCANNYSDNGVKMTNYPHVVTVELLT